MAGVTVAVGEAGGDVYLALQETTVDTVHVDGVIREVPGRGPTPGGPRAALGTTWGQWACERPLRTCAA